MNGNAPSLCGGFDPDGPLPRNPAFAGVRWVVFLHVVSDLVSLVLAYLATYWIRFGSIPLFAGAGTTSYAERYLGSTDWYLLLLGVPLFVCYTALGLYEGSRRLRRTPLLWNFLLSNAFVMMLMASAFFFRKNTYHMPGFLPLVLLINAFLAPLMRHLANALVARFRRRGRLLIRVLLVGDGPLADEMQRRSDEGSLKGNRIVRRIPMPATPERARAEIAAAITPEIASVFVVDESPPPGVLAATCMAVTRANRAQIVFLPEFLALHNPFSYGDLLRGKPLVHVAPLRSVFPASRLRVAVSSALAAVALVLLSPVFLAIAVAIRLDSPGPVFFAQDRYGLGGRRFRMLKFRTMVEDAESKLAALRSRNESDGALFKLRDDPRVTRVGKFLRKTSLDELPQLVNILRGEMRFVGPRPLPCSDIEPYLDSWHGVRQLVRPGITCIWQCAGRSDIGFRDMCLLDAWYVMNRNWVLDLRILVRTAWSVVFQHGAY